MNRGLPKVAWALAAILAVASILLSLGSSGNGNSPESTSYQPHGTAALVALLRQKGFEVRVDRRSRPHIAKDETAVAFLMSQEASGLAFGEDLSASEDEVPPAIVTWLGEQVKSGRSVIAITYPSDFGKASAPVFDGSRLPVVSASGQRKFDLAADGYERPPVHSIAEDEADFRVTLWKTKDSPLLAADKVGKGRVFNLSDGLPFSNRFIAQGDNADAALELFGMAAPNRKLVFTEASFGNVADPGLLGTIGAWAVNAWYQFLLLFVVICYSLGKRFGLPVRQRAHQAGSRQLVDALADTHQRGRHVRLALRTVINAVEAEIRTSLRLPRDTDLRTVSHQVPPELLSHLAAGRNALVRDSLSPVEAVNLVQAILQARREAGKLGASQPAK